MKLKYPVLIDGGLSNVLEEAGYDLNHSLWSARILAENPEALMEAHLAYLRSGSQIIATSGYQATIPGFTGCGYSKEEAIELIRRSSILAKEAINKFMEESGSAIKPLIAASFGPYGAYLADGSEYRGGYKVSIDNLENFHRERMEVIAETQPDIFAFETFPDHREVGIITQLMKSFDFPAWVSLSCKNGEHINDGTPIEKAVKTINKCEQVFAIGVNCTAPQYISSLISKIKSNTSKKVLVYPNSGEIYNVETKTWHGTSDIYQFAEMGEKWINEGADIIGGCCRIGPRHIKALNDLIYVKRKG